MARRAKKGLGVTINRDVGPGSLKFKEVFIGFEKVGAVTKIFGPETDRILSDLMVDVLETRGYLHIDDEKGCIVVNRKYLKEGETGHLYLDVVHELVHIKQFKEGKELFDRSFSYVDRPTEVEAWKVTVQEARRLGISERDLVEYLKLDWVSAEDFRRFLVTLGVKE